MFDNVGGKIKGVAQLVTWLGIIASVIGFTVLVGNEDTTGLSFAVLIVGCIGSWLSSLTLYGFGQLIENTDIIAKSNAQNISTENNNSSNTNSNQQAVKEENSVECKEKTKIYISSFHELLDRTGLSEEKINEVLKLKQAKDDGKLSKSDCKKQTYKIIEDLSIDKVIKILNNL